MISVRGARPDQLDWVNKRYAEIEFVPSTDSDYIAIASIDNEPMGLGRIVTIDERHGELGGMYVFEKGRGQGVSRAIIAHLLDYSPRPVLYCLPFAHLEKLYGSFGFAVASPDDDLPEAVVSKHRWCMKNYPHPVLIMRRCAEA